MDNSPHALIWPQRLSRLLERAWARGLASRPSLDPDILVEIAAGAAGVVPSPGAWRLRLDRLCAAIDRDARLNSLGQTIAHGQLLRILKARVRAERWFARHPETAHRLIRAPVVLVGQMRSGTTRAHRLLACDPAFAFTRLYETLEPVPYRCGLDRRPAAAAGAMALMRLFNPALSAIHPSSPFAPEEEFGLHAYSLWGAQFEAQWAIPSFAAHGEAASLDEQIGVYREFKRLLQLRAAVGRLDPNRTVLLKAPQFCTDLEALLTVFPDARVVRITREPEQVVGSGASLAWHQMRIQSDVVDRAAVGAEWLRKTVLREQRLGDALGRGIGHVTLDYDEVSRDWRGAMARVYGFLGRPLTPAVEARMARFVAGATAHRGHRYALEDFGLDAAGVRTAFA